MDLKLGVLLVIGAYLCSTHALPPGLASCVCTRNYKPVCGSNGVTYSNQCLLNCERDTSKSELTKAKEGPCDAPERCICTFNYLPVCGSDSNTYPNECTLKCQQNGNSELRLSYQGECKTLEQPPCTCPRKMEPVCGTDGITYNNDCLLNCATANDPMLGVKSYGACEDNAAVVNPSDNDTPTPEQPACSCPRSGKQVCGSDGNTYHNDCLLNCATANDPSLRIKSYGACEDNILVVNPSDVVKPTLDESSCSCPRSGKQVCGSDGNTYYNDCLLNCATANDPTLRIKSYGACEDNAGVVNHSEEDTPNPEQPTCSCPRSGKQVCGSDGNTYYNDCLLNCATANDPTLRIKSYGACEDNAGVVNPSEEDTPNPEQPTCSCPRSGKQVCGSDGNTYYNDCLLNCATANDPTLRIKSYGACEDNAAVENSNEDENDDDDAIHPSLVRCHKKKDSE